MIVMPRNPRPGGIFGDWGYGWEGTTLNERIQAQNVWDLLAEQEKANKINEQRLEIEQQKLQHDIQKEKDNLKAAKLIDESNKQNIKTMQVLRLIQLCDNLGTDFNDIATFAIKYFEQPSMEKLQDYQNKIDTIQNEIYTLQNNLDNTLENALKQIEQRRRNLQCCIKEVKKKIKKQGIINRLLYPTQYKNKKQQLDKLQQQYNNLDKQEQETIRYINTNESKIMKDKQDKIQQKQQQIQKLQEQKTNYINYVLEHQKQFKNDFNTFRTNHYNDDMEMLFRKLNIPFDKVQCKKEGTIKDYNRYIISKIEE